MKNETMTVETIRNLVYIIRNQQVMLDSDLAELYGYEVKNLNRQVKNNIDRFPEDFMFRLTKEEVDILRCNNFIANISSKSRTNPYAFTEQGIYMLATVLKGELAKQQSIFIMRAFKQMRHYIVQNQQFVTRPGMNLVTANISEIAVKLASVSSHQNKTDKNITYIQKRIDLINNNFISDKDYKEFVIYKGEKFEADVAYIDIYRKALKSIYIIYRNDFLTNVVVSDFQDQYPPLKIKPNPDWHFRLIILDYNLVSERVFHCGASSKDDVIERRYEDISFNFEIKFFEKKVLNVKN